AFAGTVKDAVPDVSDRLSGFAVDNSSSDLECRKWLTHRDVDVISFTGLRHLNDSRFSRIIYRWIEGLPVDTRASWDRITLTNVDLVFSRAYSKRPINTSIVC